MSLSLSNRTPLALLVCIGLSPVLRAQDEEAPLAGHSSHGEAFNEGPRQRAYRMAGCGDVHFPVRCGDKTTQAFFDQGVGQLHGFWYFEAERSFRQVVAREPDCAMGYWGLTMANVDNPDRAAEFIEEAVRRREFATERERLWIDSLADFYEVKAADLSASTSKVRDATVRDATAPNVPSDANDPRGKPEKRKFKRSKKDRSKDLAESYAKIIAAYPDDIEALAFYVNRVWLNRRAGLPTKDKDYDELEQKLVRIFEVNPNHPAHHYRIHLWDRKDAKRALVSAAASGQSAPAIAHQWHMSGHIFAKLNRHEDAAWQQAASARVDHAHMMRDRVMPYQIHNFGHNNEWLVRSLTHVGRAHDALSLAKNMIELPRHPEHNDVGKTSSISGYGTAKYIETCVKFGMLDELVDMHEHGFLNGGDNERTQLSVAADIGAAYLQLGDLPRGRRQLAVVRELAKRATPPPQSGKAKAPAPAAAPEKEPEKDPEEDSGKDSKKESGKESEKGDAAKGAADRGTGRGRNRRTRNPRNSSLRKVKDLEALLAVVEGRTEEARQKLKGTTLPKIVQADAWMALGDSKAARQLIDAEAKKNPDRAEILARRVRILSSDGDSEQAREVFDRLRTVAGNGDIDTPLFRSLAGIASEFAYPTDWRLPRATPTDVGDRPPLDSLGPFRWQPMPATDWELPATDGSKIRLRASYRDRPVLVVFYLGFGCLHCVEQLQAFHPITDAFRAAGIDIVAIGTDSLAGMRKSLADMAAADRFAFPLVSDPDLDVFKHWRAFDDFENMPLHGTFLVDGDGDVRWQDISYEPFNKPEWLLEECKRLLAQRRRIR